MPYGNDQYSQHQPSFRTYSKLLLRFSSINRLCSQCLGSVRDGTPFGAIYCHIDSHINVDECARIYTGGAKLVTLTGPHCKIALLTWL